MTAATLARIEPAGAEDVAHAALLLEGEGLPVSDIDAADIRLFTLKDDAGIVGFGGLELHGVDVFLRSVVVDPARRHAGAGRAVVEAILAEARRLGAARAFLLTTSAEGFFGRLGFAAVERASAPAAILSTRQAVGLCPASATLMARSLS